jgi:hypothetical protein
MRDEYVAPPSLESGDASRERPRSDDTEAGRYLIAGITHQGRAFRPSDWAERLAGVVTVFVDERATQTASNSRQFASPVVHDGVKSLLIDATLRDFCPSAFAFLSCFAADNGLTIRACIFEDGQLLPQPLPP